jgi:hypothetical protein
VIAGSACANGLWMALATFAVFMLVSIARNVERIADALKGREDDQ